MAVKKVVVLGASGFLGSCLVIKLKSLGYWVRGVDIIKYPGYTQDADEFFKKDPPETIIDDTIDEVYQLAGSKLSESAIFGDYPRTCDVVNTATVINLTVLKILKFFMPHPHPKIHMTIMNGINYLSKKCI